MWSCPLTLIRLLAVGQDRVADDGRLDGETRTAFRLPHSAGPLRPPGRPSERQSLVVCAASAAACWVFCVSVAASCLAPFRVFAAAAQDQRRHQGPDKRKWFVHVRLLCHICHYHTRIGNNTEQNAGRGVSVTMSLPPHHRPVSPCVHSDRTARRHRHHLGPRRHLVSRFPESPRKCPPRLLRLQ